MMLRQFNKKQQNKDADNNGGASNRLNYLGGITSTSSSQITGKNLFLVMMGLTAASAGTANGAVSLGLNNN